MNINVFCHRAPVASKGEVRFGETVALLQFEYIQLTGKVDCGLFWS